MLTRAFIAVFAVWVLLTPAARGALGQITESEILSGCMDLDSGMTGMIYAEGKKDGQVWTIEAKWKDGVPLWIKFSEPRSEM